jgi:hypothetical protein
MIAKTSKHFFPLMAVLLAVGLAAGSVSAKTYCPREVGAAVTAVLPHARLQSCRAMQDDREYQYQVRVLTRSDDAGAEVMLDPDGRVMEAKKQVTADSLPYIVYGAFENRYPHRSIEGVDKRMDAAGTVSYDVAFLRRGREHKATFSGDGRFLAET